jgi:hypothetical protein
MIKQFLKKVLEKSKTFVLSTSLRHLTIQLCKRLEKKDVAGRLYIDLTKSDGVTNQLKEILTKIGCFRFYSTNSGEYRIGISQIVYFIYNGFKLLLKSITISKFTHQIHHLNGVVWDSYNPKNLVLLTIEDHIIVTKIQNATLDVHCYLPEMEQDAVRYNNQGHVVKNPVEFLNKVIAETLYATERWLTKTAQGKGNIFSVKKIIDFIKKYLKEEFQFKVLGGLAAPTVPYVPEEQWDNLTKIAMSDNLVNVFGSCFEYLLDEVLDITEIKPKLVPLEAIANQEEYYLPF